MKRAIVFVMLAVFLMSVTYSTVSAAMMGTWIPSVKTTIGTKVTDRYFSSIIVAIASFEGTLQAYSVSGDPNVEEQVFLASDNIAASMQILNEELKAIYSDLSEDEQSDIVSAYSSLVSYLDELAKEAEQVFQDQEKSTADFYVEEWGPIAEELPGQMWVGSANST